MAESSQKGVQRGNQPRTRQRTYIAPPTLDVPDIGDDAAERKRVLNVLAQRRYREKKRQQRLKPLKSAERLGEPRKSLPSTCTKFSGHTLGCNNTLSDYNSSLHESTEGVVCQAQAGISSGLSIIGTGMFDLDLDSWNTYGYHTSLPGSSNPVEDWTDTTRTTIEPALLTSNSTPSSMMRSSSISFDAASPASSDSSFPDSYLLPVHELTLLRACLRIAKRIGCQDQLWSLDAVSPFYRGIATPAEQLPPSWRPTPSQIMVNHHPLLDFLPWPSVRDKILGIFTLPEEMRPASATGPLALVNFAYDFEDGSEGVRIYGDDPYDANVWEVGQVFFERWWFLFDRQIIETSNRWRSLRGAQPLALKGGG